MRNLGKAQNLFCRAVWLGIMISGFTACGRTEQPGPATDHSGTPGDTGQGSQCTLQPIEQTDASTLPLVDVSGKFDWANGQSGVYTQTRMKLSVKFVVQPISSFTVEWKNGSEPTALCSQLPSNSSLRFRVGLPDKISTQSGQFPSWSGLNISMNASATPTLLRYFKVESGRLSGTSNILERIMRGTPKIKSRDSDGSEYEDESHVYLMGENQVRLEIFSRLLSGDDAYEERISVDYLYTPITGISP